MVHAKNYETVSTFDEVMQKKTLASFFPDTVYNEKNNIMILKGNSNYLFVLFTARCTSA